MSSARRALFNAMLPDLGDLVLDILAQWWENVARAFGDAWKSALDLVFYVPFWGQILVGCIDVMQQLLSDLATAGERAIVAVLAAEVVAPKEWKNRVIRADDAFRLVSESMLTEGYRLISLQTPWALRIVVKLKSLNGKLSALIARNFPLLFHKLVPGLGKIILLALDVFLAFFRQFGAVILIACWAQFVLRCYDGTIKPFLSQKAPRKRVKSEEGTIRRREPGGTPP